MGRARQILFRIFYSTTFTIVFLLTIAVTCVTPADAIYISYRRNRLLDIFVVTGAYVLTALIAVMIYASRLYTNRSVLKDIPKTFMPIEQEDLPTKRIRELIEECLVKSAIVAYTAKPRSKRIEDEVPTASQRISAVIRPDRKEEHRIEHHWGIIDHPGWASPESTDIPNLEYTTVVEELVDLIEAKAVSLAPIDPLATPGADGLPMPDARVIAALTRPEMLGMRQYLTRLIELGIIPNTSQSVAFLAQYERARFADTPISSTDFQALMRMFAEVLRSMTHVDVELLGLDNHEDVESGMYPASNQSSDKSSLSSSGSVRHIQLPDFLPPRRFSEDSVPSISTTSSLPSQSALHTAVDSRPVLSTPMFSARSNLSLHQTRSRSEGSLRSSRTSRSNGSVIRLSGAADMHDLPYTIEISRARRSQ